MSKLLTWNVGRHLLAQIGTAVAVAAAAGLARVDYSSLGLYAPAAQGAAALIVTLVNEALGTAPASS
jgi:hypothetical protein